MFKILEKIFRKITKKSSTAVDTLPLKKVKEKTTNDKITLRLKHNDTVKNEENIIIQKDGVKQPQLIASCAQSTGIQRDHNEDALFCLTTWMTGNGKVMPFGIYIVADGMGGHQHGEVASAIAVKTMASHIVKEILIHDIAPNPQPPDKSLQDIMRTGINKAHNKIIAEAIGGGTTLTAMAILHKQMTIAHVGDSRVYHINSDGVMSPLTRDHSLVERLVELGQLTPEEAALDPRRNVLYHALGQGTPLEPEIIFAPCPHSGYLLLCSDGLWGVISEDTIRDILRNSASIPEACQEMVDAANQAGGPDNITVILVRLPEKS